LVIVMRLRGNQIFEQTRMAAFAIKLRHDVDVATSTSQGSRASVRDTAYFTPD
jgi:hypothetical protein